MATVIPVGDPVNEAERRTIAHLRDNLPSSYIILHNFEVERGGELFEVDLAVIAPHAVYLVDTKGTRGLIDAYGSKWYPEGRQPYTSPLIKLRGHAKSLKGIITDSQPSRRDLRDIYVDAAVVLAAPDAVLQDPGGRDAPRVTTLKKSAAFFQNAAAVPGKYSKNISRLHNMVLKALQGVAKKRSGPLRFGNWEVDEQLGGTDAYTEYRAYNVFAGKRSGQVLLRAYKADPYLPDEARAQQRARIANAYNALNGMPGHPGIVGVRDFFGTEHEDRYVLVTEDVPGQALRLHIDKPNLALTLDQKLRVAGDLLNALGCLVPPRSTGGVS
jgi:serine/threonine protein kinase